MKMNDLGLEPLALAKLVLLEPTGLDESHLERAMARIFEHKVDYADLYFQYSRSEGWSLDEGIVKSGSFSIGQGVGVRAVSGERSAFSYSDEINEAALMSAADATRTIARAGRPGRSRVTGGVAGKPHQLYPMHDPWVPRPGPGVHAPSRASARPRPPHRCARRNARSGLRRRRRR